MLSEAEARRLVAGPFGQTLLQTAGSYVAPIYWIFQENRDEPKKINNGTIFFIDCGEGPIAITAGHVYSSYLYQKRQSEIITCNILNENFDLEENRIEINNDENIDIATFKITEELIRKIGKVTLTPKVWPPIVPKKDQGIFFAGYPGQERITKQVKETNITKINFGKYTMLETVTNIDEKSISCHFTEDKVDTLGLGFPEPGYDLGGISGAPLLILYQDPVIHWSLGGVIRQAISEYEILYATRADFILLNGKLKSL